MEYTDYPKAVVADVVRLRRRIKASGIPARRTDVNVIVGTWNIRKFGGFHNAWDENPGSPKRNLHGLAVIAEIIKCFDVIAVQEVTRDTTALRFLMEHFLGPSWAALLTDVTAGDKGNSERLAYLYDTRRVTLSGLSGELVLEPTEDGNPAEQFDRTPYMVGFRAAKEHFTLLTAHIRYGNVPADRIPELQRIARYTAQEIRDRTKAGASHEEPNLIVLGDFNIDKREGNPLFDAFIETGLWVPEPLQKLKTNTAKAAKYFDQLAWFRDDFELRPTGAAGNIDFSGAVFKDLSVAEMTHRVSDHLPLWVELSTDRSEEAMAGVLGVDIANPDAFAAVAN